jgi:hypothetical protein
MCQWRNSVPRQKNTDSFERQSRQRQLLRKSIVYPEVQVIWGSMFSKIFVPLVAVAIIGS